MQTKMQAPSRGLISYTTKLGCTTHKEKCIHSRTTTHTNYTSSARFS